MFVKLCLLLCLIVSIFAEDEKTEARSSVMTETEGRSSVIAEAEGKSIDGQTEARFFLKKPGFFGNRYSNQCNRCSYGYADSSTSRYCCRVGYQRCCHQGGYEKSGRCPYYSGYGNTGYGYSTTNYGHSRYGSIQFQSSTYCYRDSDCYGSQKCCRRNSYGSSYGNSQGYCTEPVYVNSGGYEKPGTCPYSYGSGSGGSYPSYPFYHSSTSSSSGYGSSSYCRRDCYRDADCPGSQKCCQVNCSSVCQIPNNYYR